MLTSYAENSFFGIPLEIYSTILAVGVIFLFVVLILHIFGYIFSRKIRAKTLSLGYFFYFKIIGVLALLSTIFALIYQFWYLLVVCELCWWQRIFMFPIEFITLSTLVKKSRGNELAILLLAGFGIFYAGYHYYLHFTSWVLKSDVVQLGLTSCNEGGILPSCTDPAGVLIFEFLTIPFMALVIFLIIFWLAFIAGKISKTQK